MDNLVHIRCNHCGEQLTNRKWPYCPPCNLYLCYRAMPILLGMLLPLDLRLPQSAPLKTVLPDFPKVFSCDDEPCIMVAYNQEKTKRINASAYEEELCIIVPY